MENVEPKPEGAEVKKPLATVVITLNTDTGDLNLAGNVLIDQELTVKILIEALHCTINKPVQKMN